MYPISHCAKMYYNGSSRLAGIGAPKHGCKAVAALAHIVRPLLSAVCRCAAAAAVPRWLRARGSPPSRCRKKSRRRELQLSACCNFAVEEQSRRLRLYFTTPQSALFQCVPGPPLVRSSHSYTH